MKTWSRLTLVVGIVLLHTIGWAAGAQLCAACGNRLTGTTWARSRAGYKERALVCDACVKLGAICYVCKIPVVRNYTTIEDGRLLCAEDAAQAVLDQEMADKVFDQVKSWCQGVFANSGALPHRNIKMILESKTRVDRLREDLTLQHDVVHLLMGLTSSRRNTQGEIDHTIYMLYGLPQPRFTTTAAHEYSHAWLNENVRRERKLERDTIEGFCDWISYKYATERALENEIQFKTDSTYSRGQMQAFLAAEKEHGFYRVIQWLKSGADSELDPHNLSTRDRSSRADRRRTRSHASRSRPGASSCSGDIAAERHFRHGGPPFRAHQ
jgi:hypothetical protein